MPVHAPNIPEYMVVVDSHETTRPAASFGTVITPNASANTYGSYIEVIPGASLTHDCYGLMLRICDGYTSGATRDTILTIGVDPTATSTFTALISDLVVGAPASNNETVGFEQRFFFPLFLKAGTQIAVKSAVNAASATGPRINIIAYCAPRWPEATPVGQVVESFGTTPASCRGTDITPGGVSEGTWTQIGSAATRDNWYWQVCIGNGVTATTAAMFWFDLAIGDATNKRIIFNDAFYHQNTNESCGSIHNIVDCYAQGKVGDLVYVRLWGSATPVNSAHVAVYGVS